ncbi:hypothetical protein [Nocardioides sp. R-C-SC26]|uniref:hypothetical protein n=1 Tax=Nocardioides sp. R-C-SC26 TaxID=2870414 RepID=UPI001E5440CD|nr:hypothetical protein [Nocardioides sp. R-C-SC26]
MNLRQVASRVAFEIGQELALYRSLARWIARRPDVPPEATPLGYAQLSGPMLWLWIIGSATEVVVVEVVLRSIDAGWAHAIRVPVLVLGVWGVLWMLGQLAASRARPHLLTDDYLLIRNGSRTWVRVPLDVVVRSRAVEHEYEGLMTSLHQEDDLLLVGVNVRTNVELILGGAQVVSTSRGMLSAGRVGLWVDEPRDVVARLTSRATGPDG